MRIKINLNTLSTITGETLPNITFFGLSDLNNVANAYADISNFAIKQNFTGVSVYHAESETTEQIAIGDCTSISSDIITRTISFTYDTILMISGNVQETLYKLYNLGVVSFDVDDFTQLNVYSQNSENNALDKTLTFKQIIQGKFNHSIAIKNINIDIIGYSIAYGYNYVFIPSLNRYYYVDSLEIISGDYVRLHLREDVLMTWKNLIKNQDMFVTRYQQSDENFLIDDRLPFASKSSISYQALDSTDASISLVNTTLKYDYQPNDKCYLITTIATNENTNDIGISAPSNSGLPNISPRRNKNKHYYLLNYGEMGYFNLACLKKDSTASFVISCLWLPFDITTNNAVTIASSRRMFAGSDALTHNKSWEDAGSSAFTFVSVDELDNGALPYFITADFTFPDAVTFINYKPFMKVEIYIAFVGWVELEMTGLFGKRCIIYYSLDAESGSSTAYLYNLTDKKVMWSSGCQFGIKMDFNTANFYQNNLQRELLAISTILASFNEGASVAEKFARSGDFSGVFKAGVNVGTNVVSYTMKDALIQNSMSASIGSSETGLYSPHESILRITLRDIIAQEDLSDYYRMQGKPYNKYVTNINNLSGYLEVGEIHFNPQNNAIYQDEIQEIVSLLKDGVII